jgi:hypothetical protein
MNLRVTQCETPFFSKTCPKCGGYVEQSSGLLQLRTRFRCVECSQELKTEARWRGALGLVYALPTSALGAWVHRTLEPKLGAESLALEVVVGAVALSIAIPAILLVFRGIVYVPVQAENKPNRASDA